uniref:Uncharacterized protein n=1 Tax=Oryzias latipes TaxID=8090 RepID=A0A3P9M4P4_ORYLA
MANCSCSVRDFQQSVTSHKRKHWRKLIGFFKSARKRVKWKSGKRRATARGENVVLLGETDLDQVSIEEILKEQRLQQQAKRETEKVRMLALKDGGLSKP